MIKFETRKEGNYSEMMAKGKEAAIYNLAKLHSMVEIIDKHGALFITVPSSTTLIRKILVEEAIRCQKYIESHND